MDFIFNELMAVPLHGGGTGFISAAKVSVIIPSEDINECHVKADGTAEWVEVALPAATMKHKVDIARDSQARKFDQVVRLLSKK